MLDTNVSESLLRKAAAVARPLSPPKVTRLPNDYDEMMMLLMFVCVCVCVCVCVRVCVCARALVCITHER